MSLLTPDSGLLFWMLISFGIVVFANLLNLVFLSFLKWWKEFIEDALLKAEKARTELDSVKVEAELILEKPERNIRK